MTFTIIGTGNIAWFLGSRLSAGGHQCMGIYSRNNDAAKELAVVLAADKYGTISEIKDGDADVCFLAVSDIAIGTVAAQLAFIDTVLAHTAGAVSMDIIKPFAKDCVVLWPVYSILKNNLPDHKNIPCAWEASSEKARQYVLEMGLAITVEMFEAKYEQRKWLHLAAVMSNNFMTHLMAVCEQMCTENRLPFSALLPIMEQTFERVKHTAPHQLQTGPAIRHDTTTLQEHLSLLNKHPYWQKIYEAMTDSILQL